MCSPVSSLIRSIIKHLPGRKLKKNGCSFNISPIESPTSLIFLNGIFFLNDTRISELSYEIPSINVDKASFEAVFGLNPDDFLKKRGKNTIDLRETIEFILKRDY